MFEKYQFAGVYIAVQAVLTLYAQGKGQTLIDLNILALFEKKYIYWAYLMIEWGNHSQQIFFTSVKFNKIFSQPETLLKITVQKFRSAGKYT